MATKQDYLKEVIKHIDIKEHNVIKLVDSMEAMAFSARDLNRAAQIYDMMLKDKDCAIILTLAGSLFSAGLKKVVFDLVNNNMVDAIVSTGAIMVDQDFFEALGFKHYIGTPFVDDNEMRDLHIDRIYDTFIDEDELRICDDTTAIIFDSLEPRPYSSRELLWHFGKYLEDNGGPKVDDSVVYTAYKKNVPIFVPAFSDCSAGFGIVMHQVKNPDKHVSIDSGKDFLELTQVKLKNKETGIFMIGGGVPKNFTQDIVVAADLLQEDAPMHKYAIQITVADVRDGALSSSTLKEASSWGKVETTFEQMVYSEATLAMPLIAGYGYHKGSWKNRTAKELTKIYAK
ncbi:MAG: deoxyhypusine synthase-like protein [Ignavibacteria bacterium]|nr:MAG: deoxyhypusine synthase-like protein [Ignavibacteria bacterium]KAF0161295.1 MAG: deoxyhypusine synthase-like protein [Ignavibacteria bacterium]